MKRTITLIMLLLHISLIAPPNPCYEDNLQFFLQAREQRIAEEIRQSQLELFLMDIGFSESGNNPYAYNTLGYIGEWQFGQAALIETGYSHVCRERFMTNPDVFSPSDQRDAMLNLMELNYSHLRELIAQFEGTSPHGVIVTKSGVLAAAHLAGATGVRQYLLTGTNRRDAYGTRLTDYLERFAYYNF